MNTAARSILSGSAGIAMIAFTAFSAATAGFAAPSTVLGVGAFVLWGLFEIAALDYVPRALIHARPAPVKVAPRVHVRVPAVVEYAPVVARRAA